MNRSSGLNESEYRVVALEYDGGGKQHLRQNCYMLLPRHIEYEDKESVPIDFRLEYLSMMGGMLHSPIAESNGNRLPSITKHTPDGIAWHHEYHDHGKRMLGPEGFAVTHQHNGDTYTGFKLKADDELDEDNPVRGAAEIFQHMQKHQQQNTRAPVNFWATVPRAVVS
jgi:hypothetical protein